MFVGKAILQSEGHCNIIHQNRGVTEMIQLCNHVNAAQKWNDPQYQYGINTMAEADQAIEIIRK